MAKRPTIAIIGTGISGLSAAYFLQRHFDIAVYEQEHRVGGHTNTRVVDLDHWTATEATQLWRASSQRWPEVTSTSATEQQRSGGLLDVRDAQTRTWDAAVAEGRYVAIDTGFIVYNDRTYPQFIRLLDHLGLSGLATEMSFSVRCEASGIEYCGTNLNTFFAQRVNVLRPSFYRFLWDFRRFERQAMAELEKSAENQTVGEFFARNKYSDAFYRRYFLPMGAAIWSCPQGVFEQFPIRFICQFYHHHGLLSIANRPQWRVIRGGSHRYLQSLTRPFDERIHTSHQVESVRRLETSDGGTESHRWLIRGTRVADSGQRETWEKSVEHVVFACHTDQALSILGGQADPVIRDVLTAFPYEENVATLHTDESVLPRNRRAWAAWNYHLPASGRQLGAARRESEPNGSTPVHSNSENDRQSVGTGEQATVTYNMNRLQRLSPEATRGLTFCVTLNEDARIASEKVIERFRYAHPVFSTQRLAAQQSHDKLIDRDGLSFCGAYWGNGFHEDGLQSALRVSERLLGMDPWKAVSTLDG